MSKDKNLISVEALLQGLGSIGPAAVALITTNPWWGYAFAAAYSMYAVVMHLRQEKINEIAQFITDNPEAFRMEIVKSKEFQDGFLIFLENYLKMRSQKKREVLKQILLGFTVTADKEAFDLERMDSCLEQMSLNTFEFLIFFQKEIRPKIESDLQQERQDMLIDFTDRSAEWHHDMGLLKMSIWDPISVWLHKNYNPSSEKVKNDYEMVPTDVEWDADKLARASTREKEESTKVHESLLELDTLGIAEKRAVGGGFGGGAANSFYLTLFGIKFLKYFNEAVIRIEKL